MGRVGRSVGRPRAPGRASRAALALASAAALLSTVGLGAEPSRPARTVPVLEIEGVIDPLAARYLHRGLAQAASERAPLVIVQLDTPGGTMDAMRDMVRDLLGAPVPVVVYVAPPGARAASAGMFITAAAHVAAMAPGTNIGSAHPVSLGREGQKADPVMEGKVVNDAAALARAIADQRGRNAAWLERAVRESVSITAREAQAKDVIDLVAPDLPSLLEAVDGRTVETTAGPQVLDTRDVHAVPWSMTLPQRILRALTDPNVAYLLLTLGFLGLAAELYHPGMIFPGVAGLVSVVLALVAFGSLPVNWAGVFLVALGLALIVLDALVGGIGLVSVGGAAALVLGSLFLYRPLGPVSPAAPDVAVSPWLVAAIATVAVGFSAVVARALWRLRHAPVRSGPEALIGHIAVAESALAPAGRVRLDSELWSAVAEDPPIEAGARVRVHGVEGVTLRVSKEGAEHDEH